MKDKRFRLSQTMGTKETRSVVYKDSISIVIGTLYHFGLIFRFESRKAQLLYCAWP